MLSRGFQRSNAGFVGAIFAGLSLISILSAQTYQGGVRGSVTDSQSASVASAKVTLTNMGTGVTRSTLTADDGTYVFSNVDPANYSVIAESTSFKRFEQKGVIVGTQEFVTVDIQLEVGNVTQSVTVTEQTALVENSNASRGQVLDRQQLVSPSGMVETPRL